MNGRTAWSFSAKALNASQSERCSRLLRPIFFQFGVTWFWVALAIEGRAVEVWRELQGRTGSSGRLKVSGVWSNCAHGLREAVAKGNGPHEMRVPAWSLPDRMRSLGLGRMWAVLCPYCNRFHMHSPGDGRRKPHCCGEHDERHYMVQFSGPLPLHHHRQFFRSSRADLPKFLHESPEDICDDGQGQDLIAA